MAGFNLPPGCSVSDIPGNRPEDLKEEAFWETLCDRYPWMAKLLNGELPDIFLSDLGTAIEGMVDWVRTETYREAYSQACMDAEEAEMERLLEKEEKG
jgi:hypothetical protein